MCQFGVNSLSYRGFRAPIKDKKKDLSEGQISISHCLSSFKFICRLPDVFKLLKEILPVRIGTILTQNNRTFLTYCGNTAYHTFHVNKSDGFTQHHFVKWTNKKGCRKKEKKKKNELYTCTSI